jgi:type IV pilus assembly protein PilB
MATKPRKTSAPFQPQPMNQKSTSLKATVRDQSGAGKTKIGEILSKEGHITSTQLKHALDFQKTHSGRLSTILLRLGYVEDETIVNVLSRRYNYPAAKLGRIKPDQKLFETLPYETAKKFMAFPLSINSDGMRVTMAEPTDTLQVENLQKELNMTLRVSVSTEKEIVEAYQKFYKIDDKEFNTYFALKEEEEEEGPVIAVDDFGSLVSEAEGEIELQRVGEEEVERDEYLASDAPIIKLVNGILVKAINDSVSDIHIEPFENSLQIRYRLDGALYRSMNLPVSIKNALNSRVKILSGLDIAERRVPQDGRIKMSFGRRKGVDIRVSTLPTLFGESIVMRILDRGALSVDLTKLGFEAQAFNVIKRSIFRPYGLLLVTGPTGSGKTTTLYSILNTLNKEDTKILTVEDPVEFNFRGINQVNVKEKVGMTFARALRAFLRQDPDVIMVGEIRDLETAEIAIKAAMTGHLVFATLHTNDSPSTIARMVDIGIPSYMLASSVTMVLSQRLARKLCPECKILDDALDPSELENMGFLRDEIPDLKVYRKKGCSACNGTGYKGRVGLYEIMEVTEEVEKAINANLPEDQLRKMAIQEGMITLREAGLDKVRQSVTSIEEVLKRTNITKDALPEYLVNPDVEQYADREAIIREGNTDKDFFMLVQGSVIVVKGGKKIAQIVQPGEYFGEMSAITGEPRSASIISYQRSVVRRFPGDKLSEIIEKYPNVAWHLFEVLASRLNQADRNIFKLLSERSQKN